MSSCSLSVVLFSGSITWCSLTRRWLERGFLRHIWDHTEARRRTTGLANRYLDNYVCQPDTWSLHKTFRIPYTITYQRHCQRDYLVPIGCLCQYQCNWLPGRTVSEMTYYVLRGTLSNCSFTPFLLLFKGGGCHLLRHMASAESKRNHHRVVIALLRPPCHWRRPQECPCTTIPPS